MSAVKKHDGRFLLVHPFKFTGKKEKNPVDFGGFFFRILNEILILTKLFWFG